MGKLYMTVEEVAEAIGVSKGYSYVIVRAMNKELQEKGYITVAGKVPTQYFKDKYYGFASSEKKGGKVNACI